MKNDITNGSVVKFLSLETIGSALVSVLVVGVAWGALSSEQNSQKREIDSIRARQSEIKHSIDDIKVAMERVSVNQDNFGDNAKQAAAERRRIEDKIDKIVDRLMKDDK